MVKRAFDTAAAGVAIILLSPLFVLAAAAIKLDSRGPVLFRQLRVGRQFRRFFIYKLRTMVIDAERQGPAITRGGDPRVTRVGRVLRMTKVDELPQLLNVLIGDMSLVGPRPEVPKYVELFWQDYAEILQARPGLTDLASIKYRNEAATLAQCQHPEEEYVTRILPDKVALAKEYIRRASFVFDIVVIVRTLAGVVDESWPRTWRQGV